MRDQHVHEVDAHPERELIQGLEPDQLVAAASKPLPRAKLSAAVELALWCLRLFLLIVAAMVIYTFVLQLFRGAGA